MRWIAAAAAVVVIILVILLRDVISDRPRHAEPPPPPVPTRPDAVAVAATADAAGVGPPAADAAPGVFVVKSTEFWDRVDSYPRQLMGYVADCYKGGKDRKAKLKVSYQLVITNHQVTLRDIRIMDTTLGDENLEQCMVRSLEKIQFADPEMPDYASNPNDPEELLIRIEGLKRFLPEQENGMQ